MSYQVLARKWRPRNFATLVGQEHVIRALSHALGEGRLHHAYLFTGTRGVGKTTLARILAKSLNCEAGISAQPCGRCSACEEIDGGRFVDLLEVDAATNTKVDEMRQLLENAVYAPTRGRFKVYVIDEVHMLSNSAFNAMLKTLEEPPEHVKFILATTDPQKIPVTVLSRCLQFNLKQMPPAAIVGHLGRILEAEGVEHDLPALQLIARSASGSMRDALSLLDQAIAHGAGKVEAGPVREMLGTVDLDYLFRILELLVDGNAEGLIHVADQMGLRSLSFSSALHELASLLTRIQVAQLAPGAVPDEEPERARLIQLASLLDPEFVQLAYQIVVVGRNELGLAPDDQAGFLMTLLRLFAFRPESAEQRVLAVTASVRREAAVSRGGQRAEAMAGGSAGSVPVPSAFAKVVQVAPAGPGGVHPVDPGEGESSWPQIVAQLPISGMARELAQQCELRELGPAACLLRLPPEQRHLLMKPAQDKVQQALGEHFARPMALRIEVAAVESATPAASAQRERVERQGRAVAAIESDSFVLEALETLDATLVESSIKPLF